MNRKHTYYKMTLLSVLLVLTVVFANSCSFSNGVFNLRRTPQDSDYGINELLTLISDRYIGKADSEELVTEAKRAIVDALNDEWSYYMTPEEYTQYQISSENTYHGIGVEVFIDEELGGITVTNVFSNSGAFAAGILPGDTITEIDGESVRGLTLLDVRSLLRRPLGDTALLTVLRHKGNLEEITVIYDAIFTDPISHDMFPDNIGYVYIKNFEGSSADNFINAVSNLIEQGAEAFIFDVRSNNGGRVNEMSRMLNMLLPECEIFISVDETGIENVIKSDADFIDLPAVVLVNSHSYSGAEYFTATLSEYGYATTVGEPTTGKNRMQSTIRLSNGGALHISTAMFLTPKRVDLYEQGGYTPDYVIPLNDEQFMLHYSGTLPYEEDPQLQKAIQLLK